MRFRTVLILTLTALSLGAQGRLRPDRPHREPGERRATPVRDRIMARLHEMRSRRLQDTLGLSEEKAHAIADRWALFDEDTFARRHQTGQLRQQMNATLMGPGSEGDKNRKLQPIVEQLAGLRQQQHDARQQFETDIRGSLSPAQQGRFILLVEEFQRNLQEALQERRKDR